MFRSTGDSALKCSAMRRSLALPRGSWASQTSCRGAAPPTRIAAAAYSTSHGLDHRHSFAALGQHLKAKWSVSFAGQPEGVDETPAWLEQVPVQAMMTPEEAESLDSHRFRHDPSK